MVPSSVENAWQNLPESKKAAVCRLCAKKQPLIFTRWVEAAGLKSFRRDSLANRKAGSAARLDAVLFNAEDGHLAMDLLVAYFTDLAPEVNNQYLDLLESAGDEAAETKLKIYAQLATQHRDWPYLQLYLATALWVEEFAEADIARVETFAAELASPGDAPQTAG
ncbi:MAG: hypothetical protein GXP51_04785 [Deltaproteobacteria bacterium]|nr:hypothetical protein [Deltaproteobacteria bacterium]